MALSSAMFWSRLFYLWWPSGSLCPASHRTSTCPFERRHLHVDNPSQDSKQCIVPEMSPERKGRCRSLKGGGDVTSAWQSPVGAYALVPGPF